ncbi:YqcI/YcgG family protein [Priestia koreensis]|uniref:YqcI/YcgG family protein n=1 Tax=Priestia koreensis TaxID=284581 RepID=UPI00203AAAC9|nr:YqcI/YcgG family protein [Priestia koreensis]MCM3006973.1 YqcI/YcgG family protein [Priestia koreensis]
MTTSQIYTAGNVLASASLGTWEKECFSVFQHDLVSKDRPFPCVLGVEGFKQDLLRFCFVSADEGGIENLAACLYQYLQEFRTIGRYTSFVAFFEPGETLSLVEYEQKFWDVLQALHERDEYEWPEDTPQDPSHPLWEFCFSGEPIFVVCNTPAHLERKSRASKTFMITFQPRWVFEGLDETSKKGQHVKKIVRKRLQTYDNVPVHPELGWYGQASNREWKQYFLRDDQDGLQTCPFQTKRGKVHASKKSLY